MTGQSGTCETQDYVGGSAADFKKFSHYAITFLWHCMPTVFSLGLDFSLTPSSQGADSIDNALFYLWLKNSILSKSILVIYAIINFHLDCTSAFLFEHEVIRPSEIPTSWLQWTNYITFSTDSAKYWIKLKIAVFIFKVLLGPHKVLSQWSLMG